MDNKYTSLGISYTEKQKEEMREAEELHKQDIEITDTIDSLTESSKFINFINIFIYN